MKVSMLSWKRKLPPSINVLNVESQLLKAKRKHETGSDDDSLDSQVPSVCGICSIKVSMIWNKQLGLKQTEVYSAFFENVPNEDYTCWSLRYRFELDVGKLWWCLSSWSEHTSMNYCCRNVKQTIIFMKNHRKLNGLLNLVVKIEPPRKSLRLPQCHRCQRHGHVETGWMLKPR